jgi:hypothetical protein
VFQREGKAIAAQWSAASGAWVEIGEVTTYTHNTLNMSMYFGVTSIAAVQIYAVSACLEVLIVYR